MTNEEARRILIQDMESLKANPLAIVDNCLYEALEMAIKALEQQSREDCRNCKKWNECPCGKEGHENGTSIGYSIGECKEYELCEVYIGRK